MTPGDGGGPSNDTGTPDLDGGETGDTGTPDLDSGTPDVDAGPTCGNGMLDFGEVCDTAIASGAGSCPATCTPANACTPSVLVGGGTCDATCQVSMITMPMAGDGCCPPGANSATDADCAAVCGNGLVETGETCDTTATGPGACFTATTCTASATDPCVPRVLSGTACTTTCVNGTPRTASGMTRDMCCPGGATSVTDIDCSASCGNGTLETGELCDGTTGPNACPTTCPGPNGCMRSTLTGTACTRRCVASTITTPSGTTLDMCCPTGANRNTDGDCMAMCGNNVVEMGEQCDPPGAARFCSATCQNITACGNGRIETGEDCDDGNTLNLDGCNATCKFEIVHRVNAVSIENRGAPAFCTTRTNALGTRIINGLAIGILNNTLQDSVNAGTANILFQFLDFAPYTGQTADPMFTVGVMTGIPDPARGAWPTNPANPYDWRFLITPSTVNAMRLPTGTLPGMLSATRVLTTSPGNISIVLDLGSPATLSMRNARVTGAIGTSVTAPTMPPTALTAGLTSFRDVAGSNNNSQGLCGDITVASLAAIPLPADFAMGGATACGACGPNPRRQYTYCGAGNPVTDTCNSLLDAIVGGCNVSQFICVNNALAPTQPDVAATTGGTIRTLTLGAGNHIPAAQTTGNNDAYSAFLTFSSRRAYASGLAP